jgi:tripartite-type tricarboxylate transporter receptor subunit TctC
MSRTTRLVAYTLGVVCAWSVSGTTRADAVEDFYKGKSIRMIVGASAGGGNDIYARLLARHMGRHVPGKSGFIVQNMPGAGSLIAANMLYNKAPRDGSVIGALTRVLPLDPLIGDAAKAQFDSLKFNWLGSLNKDTNIIVAWHTAPVKSVDDIFKTEMLVAAAGANTDGVVYPKIINKLMGGKFRIVAGYPGSGDMMLAMERGEVHGRGGVPVGTILGNHSDWLKAGKIKIIVQLALKKDPVLPDVPLLLDMVKDADTRSVFELLFSRQEMGRPYVIPPAVPADRVAALRAAFVATGKDKAFTGEAAKLKLPLDVISGEEVAALIAKAYATPAKTIELTKSLLGDASGIGKCSDVTEAAKCQAKKKKKKKKKT